MTSPVRFGSRWTTWTNRNPERVFGRIWRLSLHERDGVARVFRGNRRRTYKMGNASYIRVYRSILNKLGT